MRQKLWDGYEVSLGPTAKIHDEPEAGCTAAIYNRSGKVVFRTTGYGVMLKKDATGLDLDGDGKPDVVFSTDTGGGNHCCWADQIVSLHPKPRKIVEIGAEGRVQYKKNKSGRILIWRMEPGPMDFTDMADAPYATRVYRIRNGKLQDLTPEHCVAIKKDPEQNYLQAKKGITPERLKTFTSAKHLSVGDEQSIRSNLLTVALQDVFCKQYDQARKVLEQWPAKSRKEMKEDFAKSVKKDFPDFAASLRKS